MQSPWDYPDFDDHEVVHFVTDRESGLKAIIAVHSTHLGPGAGGTRFWHYEQSGDAVADALRLSRGMSYKNAMAGLPLGRSEERRVGNECVRTCRSRWSPDHYTKKKKKTSVYLHRT